MTDQSPGTKGSLYRFRFGEAEFDEASFELRVAGAVLDVQPKPLSVLGVLLANAGEVVTKEELIEAVWAGRQTVDHVVANAVSKLRTALGDETGAIIVTVPRVGYRLAASVERVAVGRALDSQLALRTGDPVPERPNFELHELLHTSPGAEVWLARHAKTRELRVYKFSVGGERLSALKREATLFRLLQDSWGNRDDFVRIIDWNFQSAPYFLECEYGGQNLEQWSLQEHLSKLDRDARLALFLSIADAVAAAHAIGVLHKDLKPGNVLIAPKHDGGWQVRLTDFGSARLLEPERLADIGITRLGFTRDVTSNSSDTGTPLYVAPELLAHQTPTVKSDLYSLGILLYQVVIGDLRRPMGSGWQRNIDDALLRADIEATTDIDPRHRLNSVAELSDRLRRLAERHREFEHQQATAAQARLAEAALQRARDRQPWIVATIAVLAFGLIVSASLLVWSLRAESELERQTDAVRDLNDFLTKDLIGQANPTRSGRADLSVADALRAAAAHIDTRLGSKSLEGRAEIHRAVEEAFSGMSDYANGIAEGRKALALYAQIPAADPWSIRRIKLRLVRNLSYTAQTAEAKALLDSLFAETARERNPPLDFLARLYHERGFFLRRQHLDTQALPDLEKAHELALAAEAPHELRNMVDQSLANVQLSVGQIDASRKLLEDLERRQTHVYGADSVQVAVTLTVLGNNLLYDYRLPESRQVLTRAIDILSRRLGPKHVWTLSARDRLASVLYESGEFALAASEHADLYEIATSQVDGRKETRVVLGSNWALDLYRLGRIADAERLTREALTTLRSYADESSPVVQIMRYDLARYLLALNRAEEARTLLDGLDRASLSLGRPLRNWEGWLAYESGRICVQTGRPEQALVHFEKALALEQSQTARAGVDDRELAALARDSLAHAQAQIAATPQPTDKRTASALERG